MENICTHLVTQAISVGDYEKVEINRFKNNLPMQVSMIFTVEIKEEEWEEIISFLGNLIDLEEETIDLNCILLTELFHVGNMDLEIVQIGHILQTMLLEYLVVFFAEKAFELKYEIIEHIFVLVRGFQKCIYDVDEFVSADDRVNESGNLVGDHESGENSKVWLLLYRIFP